MLLVASSRSSSITSRIIQTAGGRFCGTTPAARGTPNQQRLSSLSSSSSKLVLGRDREARSAWTRRVVPRAEFDGSRRVGEPAGDDEDDSLVQVTVERVVKSDKNEASVLYLSLLDRSGSIMPVYVGEAESVALDMELSNKRTTARPIMYDLFKSFVETSGYELSHVIIDDLKSKTYHATCYFSDLDKPAGVTIKLDSRPSDALNLAVRFNKPVYVTKVVLEKARDFLIPSDKVVHFKAEGPHFREVMDNNRMSRTRPLGKAGREEIEASIRRLLMHYVDPDIVELQARLQVAVSKELYEDAAKIRDEMGEAMSKDRMASVCVAMESAVNDKRFEEAAVLRNTFLFLREQRDKEDKRKIA